MPADLDNTNVSRFSSLGTSGGWYLAGLLTAAASYSLFLGGDIHFDESIDATPEIVAGTGTFLAYSEAVCTNTGGLFTYTHCRVNNPYATATGVIMRAQYDVEAANTTRAINCSTTSTTTSTNTGTVLPNMSYKLVFSGASIVSSTGSISVVPGGSVRCWVSTGAPGVTRQAQLRIWWNEMYAP